MTKWWLQSYLLGVKKILCGFRDGAGVVSELKWYDTLAIPDKVKEVDAKSRRNSLAKWKPETRIKYLSDSLDDV